MTKIEQQGGFFLVTDENNLKTLTNKLRIVQTNTDKVDLYVENVRTNVLIADIANGAGVPFSSFSTLASAISSIQANLQAGSNQSGQIFGGASEATLDAVRLAVQTLDSTDATEATQLLIKNLLTSLNTNTATEATAVLVKNLLTTISTTGATETTLAAVKTALDAINTATANGATEATAVLIKNLLTTISTTGATETTLNAVKTVLDAISTTGSTETTAVLIKNLLTTISTTGATETTLAAVKTALDAINTATANGATEATAVLVKNLLTTISTTGATEATMALVKTALDTISTTGATEATAVLVKNLLTTISTTGSTEATLLLVKGVLDSQLTKLTEIANSNVSIIKKMDRRTFVNVTGFKQPGNMNLNLTTIMIDGVLDGVANVDWNDDANADNAPDVDATTTHSYVEYGTYSVTVQTASGKIFKFIIAFEAQNISDKLNFDFNIYHTHDGITNFKEYFEYKQTINGVVATLGFFDADGNAYTPILPDTGSLQYTENQKSGNYDYPELFDVTSNFVLKSFKYHDVLIQPTAGSTCSVAFDADTPVSLEAYEVHRYTASEKLLRSVVITNVTGTIRIKTLK